MARQGAVDIRKLVPELADPLALLLDALVANGDRMFHPHPFTRAEVRRLATEPGLDLYYVVVADGDVTAYGMLRGWNQGFDVPSLGIAVHPTQRGLGVGRALMHFLHAAARARGASKVRLTVYSDNSGALALYESLGYVFEHLPDNRLLGTKELR